MVIRRRRRADLEALYAIAHEVHDLDGYPPYLGRGLEVFVENKGALATWVALEQGQVIGHVALNEKSSPNVMDAAASALGRPPESLGVVARLFVRPKSRRRGVARALLVHASAEAVRLGLWPVLDTATIDLAAIALYESAGWRRVGEVSNSFADGTVIDEIVFVAPPGE